ncbi:hypothetical protein N0V88_005482 [Collariella sp. IMI 366227]|nr:hypothetical protein N0V88_005482 [Collariella sp. IMI 366227]
MARLKYYVPNWRMIHPVDDDKSKPKQTSESSAAGHITEKGKPTTDAGQGKDEEKPTTNGDKEKPTIGYGQSKDEEKADFDLDDKKTLAINHHQEDSQQIGEAVFDDLRASLAWNLRLFNNMQPVWRTAHKGKITYALSRLTREMTREARMLYKCGDRLEQQDQEHLFTDDYVALLEQITEFEKPCAYMQVHLLKDMTVEQAAVFDNYNDRYRGSIERAWARVHKPTGAEQEDTG